MAAKRAQKAIEEAKEAKANEAIRRKAGKASNCCLTNISMISHKPGLPRTCTKSRKNWR